MIGPALDLVPAAGGAYRHPSQSGSFVRFARTRAGRDVMIAPFLYAEAAPESVARWKLRALVAALLLLQLAPLGAAGALLGAAVRRRRTRALGLWMWPALAGLTLQAIPRLLNAAAMDQVLGEANVFTVGLWLSTIAFAICAIAGAYTTFRWWIRPDRPPLIHRVLPTACAIAAVGLGLWLEVHGIIGLRIWAW